MFPRISLHALPCHKTWRYHLASGSSVALVPENFCPCRNHSFEHTSVILHNIIAYLTLSFECNPNKHGRGRMLVLQSQRISWEFSKSDWCSVSFLPVWHRPHLQIRIHIFSVNEWAFTIWNFSQPYFKRTFSNCRSYNSPAKGWPYRFRSRRTLGSSILVHDFGHLCFCKRFQISGHSDFGIFNNVGASSTLTCVLADTASDACPAHPGSLEIMSMTFAAVICDADDPCSAKTAYDPESSFTLSPRSTTLPLYFWCWGSNSEFLRWQRSINDAKVSFSALIPCFIDHLFLVSEFCQLPCQYFLQSSQFCPLLPLHLEFSLLEASEWICAPDCSDSMNLLISQRCDHRDICAVHLPIVYCHRFVRIDNTSIFGLAIPNTAAGFTAAIHRCSTKHCCGHRNFKLSTSVFHGVLEFFIFWFNEEDTSQSSGIIELWFLDSPLLLRFAFRCIRHTLPHIWPYIVGSWGCLFLRQSSQTMSFHQVAFRSIKINLVKLVQTSDNSLSPSTFQWSPMCFPRITSSDVCVVLVTSMYFNGIGNDSSFGMFSLTMGSTWWRRMKSPVMDQKSFLASASSRVESSWKRSGEESSSDSPRKTSCASPRSGWSLVKVDVLRRRSLQRCFYCSICDWNIKLVTFHRCWHFLCIEPSGVDFRCVHRFQLLNVRNHIVSFPDSHRIQCVSEEQSRKNFSSKLMDSWLVFAVFG